MKLKIKYAAGHNNTHNNIYTDSDTYHPQIFLSYTLAQVKFTLKRIYVIVSLFPK